MEMKEKEENRGSEKPINYILNYTVSILTLIVGMYLLNKVKSVGVVTITVSEDVGGFIRSILGGVGVGLGDFLPYIGLMGVLVTMLSRKNEFRRYGVFYKSMELSLLIIGVMSIMALK